YSMQLGSGTWDIKPGVTYNGRRDDLTWGAQYVGTIRTGDNSKGYTLGNRQDLTAWLAYSPRPAVSFSGRFAYQDIDSIDGADPLIMAPVQTADPNNYGGKTVIGYIGVNFAGQEDWRRGHRLALEYGKPVSQDLNGPQMKLDSVFTAGWQYAF
ncbi:MAG: transporter, partial [Gammaproteobacteria bacterium]|nr:transporter [Gammaproteobacteria bacterium]